MAASSAATDLSRPTNKGTMRCGKTTMSRSGRIGRVRVMLPIWAAARRSATEALAADCVHEQQGGSEILQGMDGKCHADARPCRTAAPGDIERREDQERPPDHQPPSRRLQRMRY